jgi:DNA polymerase III delta prime subunit
LKDAARIPITYCVWFTKSDFKPPASIEWEDWQFLNIDDLGDVETAINRTMDAAIATFHSRKETRFINPSDFNDDMLNDVGNLLRPRFEYLLSESANRKLRKNELTKLLEDQYEVIDGMEDNQQVLVSGPAGTGKTLLALEKVRRLKSQGLKVKFLCFNTSLAAELSAKNIDLDIENISKVIYRIAQTSGQENIDIRAVEAAGPDNLGNLSTIEKFDVLVLDEAQDLFNQKYLPWISFILKNGMRDGSWFAFGDFEFQNLYSTSSSDSSMSQLGDTYMKFKLKHNCRNLPLIGHLTYSFVPEAPKWKSFRRTNDGVDPVIKYTKDSPWSSKYLDDAIDYFRSERFTYPDIVILTPNRIMNPQEMFSDSKYCEKFAPWALGNANRIRFSTIHSFKGLESPCVLLLQLYELKNMPENEDLKYTAFTRATDRLYIIADSDSEKILQKG